MQNTKHHGSYKYYDLVMAGFVAVLLCSNLIGPGKVGNLFGFRFDIGNIFFPISYIFGDILTEVYGYARTRRVVWAGFGAMLFATLFSMIIVHTPADPTVEYNAILQPALETAFGATWRIMLGSVLGFLCGDFVNSYVLAKMKILTKGKYLWTRTIGSTLAGQSADSLVFYPIAFLGIWSAEQMIAVIAFNCFFKVMVEFVMTPVTYIVVNFLKKHEHEDYYDYNTNFTPFSIQTN